MQRMSAIAFTGLAVFSLAASAQSGGGSYVITRSVIAGGGATLSGGAFQLSGAAGQPATTVLDAAGYRLYDGFWGPLAPASDVIFRNGFDP
ncbi:MAG TPA: hypothetical protein VGO25_02525 [Rhodanobacteraceae bacterium]|nr:hypothetical protein [Rhodanobacteraceae bacterium]